MHFEHVLIISLLVAVLLYLIFGKVNCKTTGGGVLKKLRGFPMSACAYGGCGDCNYGDGVTASLCTSGKAEGSCKTCCDAAMKPDVCGEWQKAGYESLDACLNACQYGSSA